MTDFSALIERIESRTAVLGVIGMGYVGLPVAAAFAEAGFSVIGLDVDVERLQAIRGGRLPFEGEEPDLPQLVPTVIEAGKLRVTEHYRELAGAEVVLIAVETPVDSDHRPRYQALESCLRSLGPVLTEGALVIVESTVAPGTLDSLVAPLLTETSGLALNEGYLLGHCPERVMPGRLLSNLHHMSRVCGGSSEPSRHAMVALYGHIVDADLDPSDCLTAELVKTAENAYRDVNIAFANELALICEAAGGDVWRVRELVNKSPGRNVLLPGAGVGGHCIPKDPWLLARPALAKGRPLRLIPAAREVNDLMPDHLVEMTERGLAALSLDLAGARILVLGYSYREDTDDSRNSPTVRLVERLRQRGADVAIHDPLVEAFAWDLSEATDFQAAILMVSHQAYRDLDPAALGTELVVDGRGLWRNRLGGKDAAFRYLCLGTGS